MKSPALQAYAIAASPEDWDEIQGSGLMNDCSKFRLFLRSWGRFGFQEDKPQNWAITVELWLDSHKIARSENSASREVREILLAFLL